MQVNGDRGQVEVGAESLHYRGYLYWWEHGNPDRYRRETLCHYFWASTLFPLMLWFFKVPIKSLSRTKLSWLRPATILAFGLFVFALFAWTTVVVIMLLGMVGACVLIGIMMGLHALFEEFPDETLNTVRIITLPIWILPYGLFLGLQWLSSKVIEPYAPKVWEWFMARRYAPFVYPWTVAIALLVVGLCWLMGVGSFAMYVVLPIAGVVSAIAVIFCAIWLVDPNEFNLFGKIGALRGKAHTSDEEEEAPRASRGTGMFTALWRYLVAKKHKICPFIVLPDDDKRSAMHHEFEPDYDY